MDDSKPQSSEAPAIPSALMGQVPRRTRLSGNSLLPITIITVLLVAGVATGLVTGNRAVQQAQHRTALRAAGSNAIGNIDELTSGRHEYHVVWYSFVAGDGAIHKGQASVPDNLWSSLKLADPLPVLYLPGDPTVNHPAGWEWSAHQASGSFVGPAIFVAGALASLLMIHAQRRLIAEGVPAVAVIAACSSGTGRSVWFAVKYVFHTEDGTEIQGSGQYGSRLEVGARIIVLYLPQNPNRSAPYASAYYRAT